MKKIKLEQFNEHLLQMAVYARAASRMLGTPLQTSLCFLAPRVEAHIFTDAELEAALESVLAG